MDSKTPDGFLRLSNRLLEAFLQLDLTAVQWRILLWTLRNTIGWNRQTTPFSCYRIAKELSLDRGGVVRMGKALLKAKVLLVRDGCLGIEENPAVWDRQSGPDQLWMTSVIADGCHPKAMTGVIANDDERQRKRCPESSLLRRAKDSCKDRLKTYKDTRADTALHRTTGIENIQRRHLAGAAKPIPHKYDGLSQN